MFKPDNYKNKPELSKSGLQISLLATLPYLSGVPKTLQTWGNIQQETSVWSIHVKSSPAITSLFPLESIRIRI
jgi:hypothetical protein